MSKKESIERRIVKRAINCYRRGTGWCQAAFALDRNGEHVLSLSPHARSYCVVGILNAAGANYPAARHAVRNYASDYCVHWTRAKNVFEYNDSIAKSKADVIRFLQCVLETIP